MLLIVCFFKPNNCRDSNNTRDLTWFKILVKLFLIKNDKLMFLNKFIKKILENCHCRDWYGDCRLFNESWIDDETWVYRCNARERLFK